MNYFIGEVAHNVYLTNFPTGNLVAMYPVNIAIILGLVTLLFSVMAILRSL